MQDSLAGLDSPQYVEEADRQDTAPANIEELRSTIAAQQNQSPMKQQVLQAEMARIQQLVEQKRKVQAQQQFSQRLQQRLNPRIGTPEDSDPQALQQFQQAQFMAKLMSQMKQRYPGMQGR